MDRWSQLSMSEKSDLMSLYIKNGISSLEEIKKHYNSYAEGGTVDDPDESNFVGGATALKKNYDYALEHLAEKYPVTAEGPWHDYGIHNPSYSQRAHWNELSRMYNRVAQRPDYQYLNPTNILEYTPIVGDAIDAGNSIYNLQQGNTGLGLAGLGMLALPNIIEKPLKAGVKGVRKLFKNKSDKAFNKYWSQLQDAPQPKAPTVHVISEPSVEITKPVFKHSLTDYNPERYPFEVSSPLGLTHTISGKDLAKIIEYSDGRLPAPSIAISSWDGIRTGRAPYPVHYDDGRYTFYFRPDYIDDMPHEAYEFDMFTPTYRNAETWAGRSLNPTEVVDTKRQMFNEFGTLLDLQRRYDLKSHKKLIDTDNYRAGQSLQEASKALKKSPNRDYGEIMPLSFVDLRQAPLIVGEGSENPLVLDFLKKLNTHKITTPELFNIKGLALKNGGKLK